MAFFLTYSLFQIAAGRLIDRFNVNWVYAAGYLLWSAATAATGFARNLHLIGFTVDSFTMIFCTAAARDRRVDPRYPRHTRKSSPDVSRGLAGNGQRGH